MNYDNILHPEYFDEIPFVGDMILKKLKTRVNEQATRSTVGLPGISVVIRTLNEADKLEGLFEDISEQIIGSEPQIIVVDNESTDSTVDIAKANGATVVTLPRDEFTYPRSMNLGVEVADEDTVFLTVGHARLSNNRTLHASVWTHFDANVAGVFGRQFLSADASYTERLIAIGGLMFLGLPNKIKKSGLGVLGATGASISKKAWENLGRFDERYESGGEDTAIAGAMITSGYSVVENSLLSVHHSHGLGVVDTAKQWKHWIKTVKGPVPLDKTKIANRRPDLDFS